MSKLQNLPHIFRQLHIHLVFAIKSPKNFIPTSHLEEVERYIIGIIQQKLYSKVIYIKCQPDHLHIFIDWKMHQPLSELVSKTKTRATSFLKGQTWGLSNFSWQNGYGAFSYSLNHVDPFIAYLKNQETYHKHHSFKSEYLTILDKFDVAYKPEYLFEFYEEGSIGTMLSGPEQKSKPHRPHTYTKIYLHLVLVVKGRDYGIPKAQKAEVQQSIAQLIEKEGHELLEIHCMPDHTHLLLVFRSAKDLVQLVDAVKDGSKYFIRKKLGFDLAWQAGFGVFSCSPSHIPNLKKYIQNQEEHHKTSSFREEYLKMLSKIEDGSGEDSIDFFDELK